jgi:peptidoglycan hydrolase-like protein with peptidoglycan-binding domain
MRLSQSALTMRRPLRFPFPLRWLRQRPRDTLAIAVAVIGTAAILINALFMQKGPHPAPIFTVKAPPLAAPHTDPLTALLPHPRPVGLRGAPAADAQPRSNTIADIQRELSRRGFYDGGLDGVYGPKTDAAIRDFEQAAKLPPSAEPNDVLLETIRRSNVRAAPAAAPANDPIAALLAPDKRLVAIQRALADFGYGPISPTGAMDAQTRAAIERFERARRRPVTGRVSEQLVRDLGALTGRPLE